MARQEKLKIDYAKDFFTQAEKYQSNHSISYRLVLQNQAKEDVVAFGELEAVMKLRAIISANVGVVHVRGWSAVSNEDGSGFFLSFKVCQILSIEF